MIASGIASLPTRNRTLADGGLGSNWDVLRSIEPPANAMTPPAPELPARRLRIAKVVARGRIELPTRGFSARFE
jgi:hypothetical protein